MVVDDIGEVVGGHPIPLDEHLVVQRVVLYGDIAKDGIVEGGAPTIRDLLPDDIGLPGGHTGLRLLFAQGAAGVIGPVKITGVLLRLALLAEAVVSVPPLHQ